MYKSLHLQPIVLTKCKEMKGSSWLLLNIAFFSFWENTKHTQAVWLHCDLDSCSHWCSLEGWFFLLSRYNERWNFENKLLSCWKKPIIGSKNAVIYYKNKLCLAISLGTVLYCKAYFQYNIHYTAHWAFNCWQITLSALHCKLTVKFLTVKHTLLVLRNNNCRLKLALHQLNKHVASDALFFHERESHFQKQAPLISCVYAHNTTPYLHLYTVISLRSHAPLLPEAVSLSSLVCAHAGEDGSLFTELNKDWGEKTSTNKILSLSACLPCIPSVWGDTTLSCRWMYMCACERVCGFRWLSFPRPPTTITHTQWNAKLCTHV